MKAFAAALALVILPLPAQAIQRYETTALSCDQVHAVIAHDGAAILQYTAPDSGLPIYDRYVANGNYCEAYSVPERDTILTNDTPSCPVYHCMRRHLEPDELGNGR
ncbi:hypothetical protein [Pararhizobium mangrovi]|uniref:KTSC domain-containing protein n=1 Tax=Pararhizobium mangrovi TaxID=2590452 RepID=A0A506TWK7_9HYPH|nr:hypothetical protein [Pararhizobium mangrovi]TPW25870.1 hypothetical protein FJU11_17410 [Pararhizobium mangrovi]